MVRRAGSQIDQARCSRPAGHLTLPTRTHRRTAAHARRRKRCRSSGPSPGQGERPRTSRALDCAVGAGVLHYDRRLSARPVDPAVCWKARRGGAPHAAAARMQRVAAPHCAAPRRGMMARPANAPTRPGLAPLAATRPRPTACAPRSGASRRPSTTSTPRGCRRRPRQPTMRRRSMPCSSATRVGAQAAAAGGQRPYPRGAGRRSVGVACSPLGAAARVRASSRSPQHHARHPRNTTIADPDDDNILAEGVGRLCEDLGVDPSDIVMVRSRGRRPLRPHGWPHAASVSRRPRDVGRSMRDAPACMQSAPWPGMRAAWRPCTCARRLPLASRLARRAPRSPPHPNPHARTHACTHPRAPPPSWC